VAPARLEDWAKVRGAADTWLVQRFLLEQRLGRRIQLASMRLEEPDGFSGSFLDKPLHLSVDRLRRGLAVRSGLPQAEAVRARVAAVARRMRDGP
jgi:hypothetical protein